MHEMSSFLKKIKLAGDNNKLYFNFFWLKVHSCRIGVSIGSKCNTSDLLHLKDNLEPVSKKTIVA